MRCYRLEIKLLNFVARCIGKARWRRGVLAGFSHTAEKGVLILCQGNICRGPYAEAALKSALQKAGVSDIDCYSAGLRTDAGKQADPRAQKVAAQRGVELSGHRTQVCTVEDLKNAQLILVMEPRHIRWVHELSNSLGKKVTYLGAFSAAGRAELVISDPFGKNDEVFQHCFEKIDAALEGLVEALHAAASA